MTWVDQMTEHAQRVLAVAGPSAQFAVDADERRNWTYVPLERNGVALRDLDQDERVAVHRLVASALSRRGYGQVTAVVALEEVLDEIEGHRRGRNSGNYWVSVFGTPGDSAWGWRFEGHHVSVNLTVAGDAVARTPMFVGANPASLAVRPLALEEDLARALLHELSTAERSKAVLAGDAPGDILTGDRAKVDDVLEPLGVSGRELRGGAVALLGQLVDVYVDRARSAPRPEIVDVSFAWAGGDQPGEPHYYRLQAPRFLVEYDNTQNGANHVHTVWRDPDGDFGEDLLRRHLSEHHV